MTSLAFWLSGQNSVGFSWVSFGPQGPAGTTRAPAWAQSKVARTTERATGIQRAREEGWRAAQRARLSSRWSVMRLCVHCYVKLSSSKWNQVLIVICCSQCRLTIECYQMNMATKPSKVIEAEALPTCQGTDPTMRHGKVQVRCFFCFSSLHSLVCPLCSGLVVSYVHLSWSSLQLWRRRNQKTKTCLLTCKT